MNVCGWWLGDDRNTPKKFRIPAGTLIAAGGFLAFNEADSNATPGAAHAFALRSAGDNVYLFSGSAGGALTGYSHGFSFAAAEQDVAAAGWTQLSDIPAAANLRNLEGSDTSGSAASKHFCRVITSRTP